MKSEHYVQLQRRKSLKYAGRQHFQDYLNVPIEFSRLLELQSGQIMRCTIGGKGVLLYTRVEAKPVTEKLGYQKWLSIMAALTPTAEPGKTYSQICKEGSIPLKSAPAIWVQQAERDIGLTRRLDRISHRKLWTRARRKTLDTKLTDSNFNPGVR